jgi:hypothetical protein
MNINYNIISYSLDNEEFNGIIQFVIRQSKEEDHVGTKDIPLVSTCNRAR